MSHSGRLLFLLQRKLTRQDVLTIRLTLIINHITVMVAAMTVTAVADLMAAESLIRVREATAEAVIAGHITATEAVITQAEDMTTIHTEIMDLQMERPLLHQLMESNQ